MAVGIVTFAWGLGWFIFVPTSEPVEYLLYQIISLTILFVGMVGYCVNWKTFFSFVLPLKVPELLYVVFHHQVIIWPIALGSMVAFYLALKMGFLFSKSWEKSFSLRLKNDALIDQLVAEKNASNEANLAKSEFIATASHDLRQPMHAVNVYLELFNPENLPPLEKKSLTKIKNSITTLNAMFDSLLNISKLDADVMQVNERVFRLKELASTLLDLTETKANNKGLALNVTCPDVLVYGDKLLLQQTMTNLIANAIQYTESGKVDVLFQIEQDRLTVEVHDTGCGIPESEQQQIFQQFFRADKTRALHDGLGLGLSIVRRLCDLMGAEVRVASEEGVGSRFIVTTPFLASTNEEDMQLTRASTRPVTMAQSLHGKCIAIIEDNPVIAEAYRHTLMNKGASVQVLSEHDHELAMQLETIDRIDCVLCDYRLGQTTGDRLIEKIRENFNEEIPAIIVTADTSPSHINLFAKLHVQVLHKPISFQEIALAIEKTIHVSPAT